MDQIVGAVNALRSAHDYVFTTGGIGPTHDDLPVDAVAQAFGVPVVIHPRPRAPLPESYESRSRQSYTRLRMAPVPEAPERIKNPPTRLPRIPLDPITFLSLLPATQQEHP